MRSSLFVLSLLLAVPFADAQVIVPNSSATNEGASNNSWPFRFTNSSGRYQAGYDATQFPAAIKITEISFRYKGDTVKPAASADFKMTLSYCLNPWNALNTTFASNIDTMSATVVFDGVWAIQPFNGDPAAPNPFTARLTLTTPFVYDPAMGDLLMDIEMRQSTYPGSGGDFARCDGVVDAGVSRLYDNGNIAATSGSFGTIGLITEFTVVPPTITPYGTGCAGTGGFVPALDMTGTTKPGQQVTLTLDNGLGGSLSALLISKGSANAPLGFGCTLLVQASPLALFIPLGGAGPGTGNYALPAVIPPAVPPAIIYLQAFVADPGSPIGMSVSNGLKVDIQ